MSESKRENDLQSGRDSESERPSYIVYTIDSKNPDRFKELNSLVGQGKLNNYVIITSTEYKEKPGAYEALIDEMEKDELQAIVGMYCDIVAGKDGEEFPIRYNPAMSSMVYNEKHLLDVPFIVRGDCVPEFSKEIKGSHLWDGLMNLVSNYLIFHCPKKLFKIRDFTYSHPDIKHDIETIKKLYE